MNAMFHTLLSSTEAITTLGEPAIIAQIGTLFMLILLQAVLGFDNLLYISLESKRAPKKDQAYVRKMGIGLAIVLRIVLLFVLVKLVSYFQDPVLTFTNDWFSGNFNFHAIIVLVGGAFIIYTATKEVMHMMRIEHGHGIDTKPKSVGSIITMIVIMNLVFSFDSILSAMALAQYKDAAGETQHIMWVMTVAIVISGILMIWLADKVSDFLQKNRMYEVLGLFILFVVGIMLVTEGAHLGELSLFGEAVMPMTKTTFYFVLIVLIISDVVQTRYQKKLLSQNNRNMELAESAEAENTPS